MIMTLAQQIMTIGAVVLGTVITRFLPFIVFHAKKPKVMKYLGKTLPDAIMGLLVIYCLKDVNISAGSRGLPELIAIAVTAITHVFFKRMLLSILLGTACYMVLVQYVF